MNTDPEVSGSKIRYGPRGKYFTEVVSKEPVSVLISIRGGRVEGVIHVHPEHRLLDEVNEGPPFLAVTEARLHHDGEIIEAGFLALNRAQINWVIPHNELAGDERDGD